MATAFHHCGLVLLNAAQSGWPLESDWFVAFSDKEQAHILLSIEHLVEKLEGYPKKCAMKNQPM